MGLASDRSLGPPRDNAIGGLRVVDTIHMNSSYGIANAPGVVAVLEDYRPMDPQSYVGRMVSIRTVAGSCHFARIEAVRDHGKTISVFFRGLDPTDVSIGSFIDLDNQLESGR